MDKTQKILVAGEGGQGVQSIAEILALAGKNQGFHVSYIPNFGVEQRGGVSLAYLQVGPKPIGYPRFDMADIVIIMGDRSVSASKKFITADTTLIFDSSFVDDRLISGFQNLTQHFLAIPAKQLAQEKFSLKATNMVVLGAISRFLNEIEQGQIESAITEKFKNYAQFNEQNLGAFRLGRTFEGDQGFSGYKKVEIKNKFEDDKKSWERTPDYCKGCGLCIERCPVKALKFSEDLNFLGTNLPVVDIGTCIACGLCEQTCPDSAIKVHKK